MPGAAGPGALAGGLRGRGSAAHAGAHHLEQGRNNDAFEMDFFHRKTMGKPWENGDFIGNP